MGYIKSSAIDQKEVYLDVRVKKIPSDKVNLPFVPHNYFKKVN